MRRRTKHAVLLVALLAAACGVEGAGSGRGGGADARPAEASGLRPGAAPTSARSLPVARPGGPIDEALASRGEDLFSARGCAACHTIGEGKRGTQEEKS